MKPKVQIFLSTYNGEKYIRQQLDSLLQQNGVEISILVRDDGSIDKTVTILKEYADQGLINFYCGENIGYAKSFLHLLTNEVQADYFAFCDQDDVWLPEKIINGIRMVGGEFNGLLPRLYVSALNRVNQNLEFLNVQNFKNLKLTLGAEFTRHRLAGCTFIFNRKLYNLLKNAYYIENLICSHDKLATILCIATGGTIVFDDKSYILFRRDGTNTSMDGKGIYKRVINEMKRFSTYKFREYNLAQVLFQYYLDELDEKSLDFISEIVNYKKNMKNTIKLTFSKKIDCGFWFYNIFIRFVILSRCF